MNVWMVRSAIGLLLLTAAIGCTSGGHFKLFGYTTEPNYDPGIRTVYVVLAKNTTFNREMEDYLTRAVIRAINLKTPMRTTSNRDKADSELTMKVVTWRKNVQIPTPTNQNRQAELGFGIEVVWKDLRPGHEGEVLSNPKAANKEPPLPGQSPSGPDTAVPILQLPAATFEPELGSSTATAQQQAIDRFAVQVISLMERPW